MKESGYYAPGTEFSPNAPWTQHDPEATLEVVDIEYNYDDDEVIVTVDWTVDGEHCTPADSQWDNLCLSDTYYFTISEHGQKTAAEWEETIINQL